MDFLENDFLSCIFKFFTAPDGHHWTNSNILVPFQISGSVLNNFYFKNNSQNQAKCLQLLQIGSILETIKLNSVTFITNFPRNGTEIFKAAHLVLFLDLITIAIKIPKQIAFQWKNKDFFLGKHFLQLPTCSTYTLISTCCRSLTDIHVN